MRQGRGKQQTERATDIRLPSIPETETARKDPRPHQQEAITAIRNELCRPGTDRRTTCVMACGTGKTLVGKWAAEAMGPRTLLAEPALSLIAQNLKEWQAQERDSDVEYLVVCSDESVVRINADEPVVRPEDVGGRVTNSPHEVARFLRGQGKRKVLVSTYHSMPVVAEAMKLPNVPRFDCAVGDEAHRTVTKTESAFTTILDQGEIRARTRLFLTATPKVYLPGDNSSVDQVISMDNEALYGGRCHTLSFSQAVARDLLCDYQLVVAAIPERESRVLERLNGGRAGADVRYAAADVAFLRAAQKYDLSKVITFHQSVRKAHDLADRLEYAASRLLPGKDVWVHAVDGSMTGRTREHLIDVFREQPRSRLSVVSNCRVLTEGVDVPAVDGVVFYDKKADEKDIIQAIGRAMRKSRGKQYGYIVVPVVVPDGADHEAILASSEFRTVWQVVRALRAHDDAFEQRCRLRMGAEKKERASKSGPGTREIMVDIDSLPAEFRTQLEARVVQVGRGLPANAITDDQILDAAREYHRVRGRLPTAASEDGLPGMVGRSWSNIHQLLQIGGRGLSGGRTLFQFLKPLRDELGVSPRADLEPITDDEIMAAAREYHRVRGKLPSNSTEDGLPGMVGRSWPNIDGLLRLGGRGLAPGRSLSQLLKPLRDELEIKTVADKRPLKVKEIVSAIRAHYKATGKIPTQDSKDSVPGLPGETWKGLNLALHKGHRGLQAGNSLSKLAQPLRKEVGVAVRVNSDTPLTKAEILAAAEAYLRETGRLPSTGTKDPVPGMPGQTWSALHQALYRGGRGLEGGSSLAQLIAPLRQNGSK